MYDASTPSRVHHDLAEFLRNRDTAKPGLLDAAAYGERSGAHSSGLNIEWR
jgi:hypothetical protein